MGAPNKFGFLRLCFAALVILSHSPELLDHNRSREPLTRIFGTLSFGDLAVDGFFLISGYLITKSWESSLNWRDYLGKRVLRIYPGFVAAFLISLLVIGPIAGGAVDTLAGRAGLVQLMRLIFLRPPELQGAFAGLPDPQLNGPLWTIACEFRCYIGTMAFGWLGLIRKRRAYLAMTCLLLLTYLAAPDFDFAPPTAIDVVVGHIRANIRFFSLFCTGAVFYLFRDRIVYRGDLASLAFLGLCAGLCLARLAGPCIAILGGYALFWFSFWPRAGWLARIGARTDLSYGIYLYAWPVQNLIVSHVPGISPGLLFASATLGTAPFACASWFAVERPFLRLKKRLHEVAKLQ